MQELDEELDASGQIICTLIDRIHRGGTPDLYPGRRYDQGPAMMSRWIICEMPRQKERHGLPELEEEEREKTGIKNLRIKYNKVFGYYLEVTNSYKDLVPDYYTRKQTLDQCGALYHTGIKRTRRYDSWCRG